MTAAPPAPESAGSGRSAVTTALRDPWLVVGVALLALAALASGAARELPWQLPLARWVDDVDQWIIINRGDHPLWQHVLEPISDGVALIVAELDAWLGLLGWPGVLLVVGVLAWRVAHLRVAAVAVAALAGLGLLGVWDEGMRTLAQMLTAVGLSLALGVPIGILAGRRPAVAAAIRPVLDTMQIIPAYVYLLPLLVLFRIGDPAGILATVIYATPPVVRLTTLGIQRVPEPALEAGRSLGASGRQLLSSVELPHALRSIRVGINQTIMMALAMVVIASLIGATGLGLEVLRGLQTLDVGRATVAGIGIVLIAVLLDRVTWSAFPRRTVPRRIGPAGSALLVAATIPVGLALGATPVATEVPLVGALDLATRIDVAVDAIVEPLRPVTRAVSDALTVGVLRPLLAAVLALPWWVIAAAVAGLAWRVVSPRFALFAVVATGLVALLGLWDDAMNTFVQVAIAAVLTLALALPLGLAAALSDRVERPLRPILDTMQTLPAFCYLIPVVALFGVGRIPGIIATIVYAMPPAVRLTSSGIRGVAPEVVEAARSQGVTTWQLLRTVQLPLARPTILLGVNQTTMMVLASIVIAGLVGAGGLGGDSVFALQQGEVGLGVEVGAAIVLLGIVLDRLTQSLGAASDERTRAQLRTG